MPSIRLSRLLPPDPMRYAPRLPPARRGVPRPGTVLLVNPFYAKDPRASYGKHVLTPSLALTSLAGATPAGWQVRFWDENLLQGPPPSDEVPQVVGITVHLTFARRACELADWFRARGSKVVLGGLHAESCARELAPHADAISRGNGVLTWPRILADVEHGVLKRAYLASFSDYAAEPPPRRGVLPGWGFLTPLSMVATRGCHNRCDFCYLSTGGLRMPYQTRPVADVVREFRESGLPYGVFTDNNLGSDPRYLRALCRGLAPLGRIWSAAISLDVTDDPSLVEEMARAGCTGVFIGFESLDDDNIRAAGKKSPRAQDYAARTRLLQRAGIQVNGSFVVGFDHDGPQVFRRIVEWVEENRLDCATYHILTPYPGTRLFRRMEAEGRLLHRDWSRYDTAHCVFQPKRMSPRQLEEGYAWMYRRTFSLPSIWRRRPRDVGAMAGYFAMSALYKKSNALWPWLIRHRLVHRAWSPLVELSRRRHLRFRRRWSGLAVVGGASPPVGPLPKAALDAKQRAPSPILPFRAAV